MGLIKFHLETIFALENAINENTAAIMVETIFGEGGIKVVPDPVFKRL